MTTVTPATQTWLRRHRALLSILVLTAVSLGRVVSFPFLTWDDIVHILHNPLIVHPLGQGPAALLLTPRQGYPMPLVILSWALEHALVGFNAAVFHLVNLLFHLTNIALAYVLFLRLGASLTSAARAAAIFALHPLVVEPVCWATGRKDLLAALLLLCALLVLSRGGRAGKTERPSASRWIGAQLLGALACLAKPSAVVAPLLLGLVCRRRFPTLGVGRITFALGPLTVVASLVALVGIRGEHALGVLAERTWGQASMDVVGALTLQTRHLLWPQDLMAAYYRSPGDPPLWQMLVAICTVCVIGMLAWRSPRRSFVRLGFAFGAVAYLPAANLLAIQRWVADSYLYLPLVGLSLGLVTLCEACWPRDLARRLSTPIGFAVVATLALLAFLQSDRWSSSASVWEPVAERYPQNPIPLARLALGRLQDGDAARAARTLLEHRQRFPSYDEILCDQAWAAARLGRRRQASALLKRGVRQKRAACIQRYVLSLLRGKRRPPPDERPLIRLAFAEAFPQMKRHIRDPRVFERASRLLQRYGLFSLAARYARALHGAPARQSPWFLGR